jgi:hypothetical protein
MLKVTMITFINFHKWQSQKQVAPGIFPSGSNQNIAYRLHAI